MGFAILFVLAVGYMIFQDFWWLIWMSLIVFVAFIAWAILRAIREQADAHSTCDVCNNWIKSVIMTDYVEQQVLCDKHHVRRMRIWDLELALNLSLSGTDEDKRKIEFWEKQRKRVG